VGVLEELIESFKEMQNRYEAELAEMQRLIEEYRSNYEGALSRLQEQYQHKLTTIEPVLSQLARKDSNLALIQQRLSHLEELGVGTASKQGRNSRENSHRVQS
jgi:uncharacterized protein YukE